MLHSGPNRARGNYRPTQAASLLAQARPSQAEAWLVIIVNQTCVPFTGSRFFTLYPFFQESDFAQFTAFTAAQNGAAVVNDGTGVNSNHVDTKADLDFIEQLDTTFDCNVEEVLQNELNLGGDIDFNFGNVGAHHVLAHAHLQQQQHQGKII